MEDGGGVKIRDMASRTRGRRERQRNRVETGWLTGLQLRPLKGLVVLFRFADTEIVRLHFRIAAMQQGVDQTVGQFL